MLVYGWLFIFGVMTFMLIIGYRKSTITNEYSVYEPLLCNTVAPDMDNMMGEVSSVNSCKSISDIDQWDIV